jgi:hypothetical protein
VVVESPLGIFREEEQLGWIHFSVRGEFVEADLSPGKEQARLEELIEAVRSEPNAGERSFVLRLISRLQAEGYNIRPTNTTEILLRWSDDWLEYARELCEATAGPTSSTC